MTQIDPLLQYYRQIKTYISVPSGTSYYDESVIKFTDSGEVGIRAMTSADELILKNPDALLNGEAIRQILISCVDGLVNPDALLINDVDAMLLAIKSASYISTDIEIGCPKCKKENTFSVDLERIVAMADKLDESYTVNLRSGATVFVKPFSYKDSILVTRKGFQETKAMQALQSAEFTDEEKLKAFSESFKNMSKLNYDLLTNSIVKIVDEEKGLDFANTPGHATMITNMLKNIDRDEAALINEKVTEINSIGVNTNLDVMCEDCKHEWKTEVELNPVNFFTES